MKAFRALLLVGLLAGCGVQADGAPRALPPDQVPEELLAPSSTADAPASPEGGILRTVWLVDNEGCLVETERRVAGPSIVASVVDSLLDGADDAEAADGLRSEIPTGTERLGIDALGGGETVQIDLSEQFGDVTAESGLRAQAQLVYTITDAQPNIEGVFFLVEGEPLEGTTDEGQLTSAPLQQRDFTDFTDRCEGS